MTNERKATIGRIAIYVEADDRVCMVALPQERLRWLMSLSDSGNLPLIAAPDGFRFGAKADNYDAADDLQTGAQR